MDLYRFIKKLFKNRLKNNIVVEVENKDFDPSIGIINLAIAFKYSGYFALIPSNLNLDEHIQRYPLTNYQFREFEGRISTVNTNGNRIYYYDKDRMLYILDLLNIIPANNKDSISEDGFVSINSKTIRKYYKDYLSYVDYLIQTGVLISDNHYEVDKKSIGYKYAPEYENSTLTPIYYSWFNINRVNPIEDIVYNNTSGNTQPNILLNYSYLSHWYNQKKLNIDAVKASKYAYLLMRKKLTLGYEHWDINRDKLPHICRKHPKTQYNAIMHNIQSVLIHDYKAKIDTKVYRLHSVITNMQKDYRNFLTYDGSQLVSIDISNSQPYLLCLLFNSFFWQRNSNSLSIFSLPESIQNMFTTTHLDEIKRYVETLDNRILSEYESKASEGIIYEYIRDTANTQLGTTLIRDDAKIMMLIVFFSNNRFFNQPDARLKRLFAELYPQIYGLIKLIKRYNHASLACLLQALESELILHRCCRRIYEESNQQVPIFTIHDSIATTLSNREFVKNIMQDELTNMIGLSPHLTEEVWSEANLKHQDILTQINQTTN